MNKLSEKITIGGMVENFKFRQLATALCLIVLPVFANAAGLGRLSVYSALGEPLNAEIDVLSNSSEELDSLTAALASEDVYASQGVERTATQANIKATIAKRPDGQIVIKLATDKVVADPYLDMIISISWKDGVLWREYTLLLDPPGYVAPNVASPMVNVPKAISNQSVVNEQNGKRNSGVGADSVEKNTSEQNADKVITKKGDSLSAIAKSLNIQSVNLDQLLVGLYNANQSAFVGSNMNRLRAGATLAIPSTESLNALSATEAKKQVHAHTMDWHNYANKLGEAVAQSVASATASEQVNTGKISAKSDDETLPAEAGSRDVVKLSKPAADGKARQQTQQDELTAKQNAVKEAEEKVATLEKQVTDMQKLLAIKNRTMANAQANVEEKLNKKNPAAPAKPEVKATSILDMFDPILLQIVGGILAFLAVLFAWARRKRSLENETYSEVDPIAEVVVNDREAHTPLNLSTEKNDVVEGVHLDVVPVSIAGHAPALDFSGVSLAFEPVDISAETEQAAPPISDAFNGDLSNLLKNQSLSKVAESSVVRAESDLPEVDTKIELASAYIDLLDKEGALELLNEALKEGSESQRNRAKALIDKLS